MLDMLEGMTGRDFGVGTLATFEGWGGNPFLTNAMRNCGMRTSPRYPQFETRLMGEHGELLEVLRCEDWVSFDEERQGRAWAAFRIVAVLPRSSSLYWKLLQG